MTVSGTVAETDIFGLELISRGKVRDVYRIDDSTLVIVATDRISAFDCVMPNQIPEKGRILTQISAFWFDKLKHITGNHLLSVDFAEMPAEISAQPELEGRSMLVKSAAVFPVECVVRGYLEGSGWKDYRETGEICGHKLPEGMLQCGKLEKPLFTPATKAASGHDENISFERFSEIVGVETAEKLRSVSIRIYNEASVYAESKGIIIADCKFEFGTDGTGNMMLIDEVLTPDSSRFWVAESYEPGRSQASFDKQFVREYLESLDWDKSPPAPRLPDEIVEATRLRYKEAFKRLTGNDLGA